MKAENSSDAISKDDGNVVITVKAEQAGMPKDNTLVNAFKMGLDEAQEALKAFPDGVEGHEAGAIWDGQSAEARKGRMPTPSEIIANPKAYLPEQSNDREQEHSHDR